MESLAKAWRRRFDREAEDLERAAQAGREGAARAARALVEEFGAREVWLFGSLAWGSPHAGSDVDIAAGGIPAERYFGALARACEVVGAQVDLVPLEDAAPSLRERIVRRGIRLDGR